MFKKYLAVLLSGVMLMSVALMGCGGSSSDGEKEKTESDGGGVEESKELLKTAIDTIQTTDKHPMMAEGTVTEVPKAEGSAKELEKLKDSDSNKWHYYEYLDWDKDNDVKFPESPGDGQKGKHVILIVHGAHAWTTCYQEAFEKAVKQLA